LAVLVWALQNGLPALRDVK